jgi:hypothetical protein
MTMNRDHGLTSTLLLAMIVTVMMTACRGKTEPSAANFTDAMTTYLRQRGDLCVARPDWPVDVTLDDFAARTRDAVQMPALERVGLVDSSVLPDASKVTRYQLTAEGRRHYIDRSTHQPVSPESPRHASADFCVAHLSLDRLVGWELRPGSATSPARALATYTYRIDAPSWTQDPGVRRAFPAVDRVISGAHAASLEEELILTPAGWVANELLPSGAAEMQPHVAETTPARRP